MTASAISSLTASDPRRRTEADPDYQRIQAQTETRLHAAIARLCSDLRTGRVPAVTAQSVFIHTATTILEQAYTEAHAEGQRDYWQRVSATPHKQQLVAPDEGEMRRRLGYYAPSVAKMAHEALMAHQAALAGRTLSEVLPERAGVMKLGGHAPGYDQNRDAHGRWAPGDGSGGSSRSGGGSGRQEAGDGAGGKVAVEREASAAGAGGKAGGGGGRTTSYALGDVELDALDQWQQSASLDNRVALQASISWSGLQDGSIDAGANDSANPYSQVWWILQPVKTMHCGDCVDLAVKSPYDPPWAGAGSNQLNQTPGDGQTECGAGCHCELDYKSNWSEVDALAAAAAWQVWLGQAGADLAAMQQIGTAAGYEPGDYSTYIRQDAQSGSADETAAPQSELDARANAYAAGQIGTGAGYRPGFSLRALPRRIPVLTGESAEPTSAADEDLTEGQQRALDSFREAVAHWNAVRGELPESLRLFASEPDAYALAAESGVLPPYDQLTPAQQEALGELVAALWDWADATDSADAAAQDDSELSEGIFDTRVMRLGGHAPGYDQNRDAHGRWAPGDGSEGVGEHIGAGHGGRQGEHEAAGGRAGGMRGPVGEVHAHAAGGGGGGAGGGGASAGGGGPSPTQLRGEIAHLRQRDAQLARRRQDLEDRNQMIRQSVRGLNLQDPAQAAHGRALMAEYNDNAAKLARIQGIHQRIIGQIAARRAQLYPNAGQSHEDEHGQHMPFTRDEFEQAMRPGTATPLSNNNINFAFRVTIHGQDYIAKEASADQGRYDAYAQARNEAATVAAMHALGDGDLAPTAAYHIEASNGSSWTVQTLEPGIAGNNIMRLEQTAAAHLTEDQLARAFLDQYVLGMQDRHSGNILVDMAGGGGKLVEIDHGFGFKHNRALEKRDTVRDIWRAKVHLAGGRQVVIPKTAIERVFNHQRDLFTTLDRFGVPDLEKRWVADRLFHLSLLYRRNSQSLNVFKGIVGETPDSSFSA